MCIEYNMPYTLRKLSNKKCYRVYNTKTNASFPNALQKQGRRDK